MAERIVNQHVIAGSRQRIYFLVFRVRVDTSINTVNKAVTTIPLCRDKVNTSLTE